MVTNKRPDVGDALTVKIKRPWEHIDAEFQIIKCRKTPAVVHGETSSGDVSRAITHTVGNGITIDV